LAHPVYSDDDDDDVLRFNATRSHFDNDEEVHEGSKPTADSDDHPSKLLDQSPQYGTFAQSTGYW